MAQLLNLIALPGESRPEFAFLFVFFVYFPLLVIFSQWGVGMVKMLTLLITLDTKTSSGLV